ncbi:MAG: DegT/DnrJ/EryC1/StrS family aminotransferase, partial [Burkholderiales bacterium]
QAALGLEVLGLVEAERAERARVARTYLERLERHPGIRALRPPPNVRDSLQYFVVRVDAALAGIGRDALHAQLRAHNVITRRYFFPLCSDYACYSGLPSAQPQRLPVATRVASEVLCLPLYGALTDEDVHRVCDVIDHAVANTRRAA